MRACASTLSPCLQLVIHAWPVRWARIGGLQPPEEEGKLGISSPERTKTATENIDRVSAAKSCRHLNALLPPDRCPNPINNWQSVGKPPRPSIRPSLSPLLDLPTSRPSIFLPSSFHLYSNQPLLFPTGTKLSSGNPLRFVPGRLPVPIPLSSLLTLRCGYDSSSPSKQLPVALI